MKKYLLYAFGLLLGAVMFFGSGCQDTVAPGDKKGDTIENSSGGDPNAKTDKGDATTDKAAASSKGTETDKAAATTDPVKTYDHTGDNITTQPQPKAADGFLTKNLPAASGNRWFVKVGNAAYTDYDAQSSYFRKKWKDVGAREWLEFATAEVDGLPGDDFVALIVNPSNPDGFDSEAQAAEMARRLTKSFRTQIGGDATVILNPRRFK